MSPSRTSLAALVAFAVSPATALAARDYHSTLSLGHGNRKVRVLTCNSTDASGAITARYKVTTRHATDSNYPRITIAITEGSQHHSDQFSLFPGRETESGFAGPWSTAATMKIKIHRSGKTKRKTLSVGDIGAC